MAGWMAQASITLVCAWRCASFVWYALPWTWVFKFWTGEKKERERERVHSMLWILGMWHTLCRVCMDSRSNSFSRPSTSASSSSSSPCTATTACSSAGPKPDACTNAKAIGWFWMISLKLGTPSSSLSATSLGPLQQMLTDCWLSAQYRRWLGSHTKDLPLSTISPKIRPTGQSSSMRCSCDLNFWPWVDMTWLPSVVPLLVSNFNWPTGIKHCCMILSDNPCSRSTRTDAKDQSLQSIPRLLSPLRSKWWMLNILILPYNYWQTSRTRMWQWGQKLL